MRTGARRLFAVALTGGGVVGLAVCVMAMFSIGGNALRWPHWPFWMLWIALFTWAIFTGVRLWQGMPYGSRWAKVIFACQVPMLTLPGFKYVWFTGASIGPVIERTADTINVSVHFEAGGSGYLLLGPGVTETVIGINLFAVVALVCLLRSDKRPGKPDSHPPTSEAP